MKVIFGILLVLTGVTVFGHVGMEQLITGGRILDGTINLTIGTVLTTLGFITIGDNL